MSGPPVAWQARVAIDAGGTFTDLCADVVGPDTTRRLRLKVPSTPDDPGRAVLAAIDALRAEVAALASSTGAPTALEIVDIRHGTTVATNALLQGRTAAVVLVTNAGFEDVLALGRQDRPDLYALQPVAPPMLVPRARIVGVRGRLGPGGALWRPLEDLLAWIARHHDVLAQAEVFAVSLLHAWADDRHERAVATALRAAFPGRSVHLSSEVAPFVREYERSSTVALDAAVQPAVAAYLQRLGRAVAPVPLWVQTSAGTLVAADEAARRPVLTALSGPAGGVAGCAAVARRLDRQAMLCLDMGGTSADLALLDGDPSPAPEGRFGPWPLQLPMLAIETVGAGGGSIAAVDAGGAMQVGPRSAGARPGPAAYGHAGAHAEPTVTDAHVVLGHLPAKLAGGLRLDVAAAEAAVGRVAAALGVGVADAARGILDLADATMARAARRVLAERGIDPAEVALCAFGGAGGLHACGLADALGLAEVIVPGDAGVLSAAGILDAPAAADAGWSIVARLDALGDAGLVRAIDAVADLAVHRLRVGSGGHATPLVRLWADLRFVGQTRTLAVQWQRPAGGGDVQDGPATIAAADLATRFGAAHHDAVGFVLDAPIELVALRAQAVMAKEAMLPALANRGSGLAASDAAPLVGPASVDLGTATLWLPPGWQAQRTPQGDWIARRRPSADSLAVAARAPSHLAVAVHRQRLEAIAEEMGAVLQRVALSANIKERRDLSTAIFRGDGAMLAHAAHIPVHLGSTPLAVAAALASGLLAPGVDVMLNDPFAGGTHTPDMTLVSGLFLDGEATPRYLVACRAHHADVGGLEPGSMPAPVDAAGRWRSLTIDDEGFRCGPTALDAAALAAFSAASRTPGERRGDLLAQQAANRAGLALLRRWATARPDALAAMARADAALLDYGERRMRAVLQALPDGTFEATDVLDSVTADGQLLTLRAAITLAGDRVIVDLRDVPDAVDSSANAVRAVSLAAVFYVLRVVGGALAGDEAELPANAGLWAPVTVLTRHGSVLDARPPAAVAMGNVETSQRIVDLLLRAFAAAAPEAIPAASAGSMSNVLLGGVGASGAWVHYETLGGGGGGGPRGPGADGLHSHMTNTRNTPVEAMELAFPLEIARYALRAPSPPASSLLDPSPPASSPLSGTGGVVPGGAGVRRAYRLLGPARVTLLGERRRVAPWGLWGAPDGVCGGHAVLRAGALDGSALAEALEDRLAPAQVAGVEAVGGVASVDLAVDDVLVVDTPCGGAWRSPRGDLR